MEITGKVIQVLPITAGTSTRTGNAWQLLTFILETQEQYPRKVAIEIFGEQRINDNPVAVDDVVTANVDVESREFNGRWYTSVRARNIVKGATQTQSTAMPQSEANSIAENIATFDASADNSTDLPF